MPDPLAHRMPNAHHVQKPPPRFHDELSIDETIVYRWVKLAGYKGTFGESALCHRSMEDRLRRIGTNLAAENVLQPVDQTNRGMSTTH